MSQKRRKGRKKKPGGIIRPVISWRMGNGSGTTISDDSGNGNHGTLSDATKWASTIQGNGSSYLDQTQWTDRSYVIKSNEAEFTNNLNWTMVWVIDTLPPPGRGYVGILTSASNGTLPNFSKYVIIDSNGIDVRQNGSQVGKSVAPNAISGPSLFMVTAEYTDNGDDFDYVLNFYQDGVLLDTLTGTTSFALGDETGDHFLHMGRADADRCLGSSYGFWYWNIVLSLLDRQAFEIDPWGVAYK